MANRPRLTCGKAYILRMVRALLCVGGDRSKAMPTLLPPTHQAERTLAAPDLSFDLEAEARSLRASPLWKQGKHSARTLIMHQDFRVVLMAMPAATRMKSHKTTQRISVHVLEGRVKLNLTERTLCLGAGGLAALDKSIVHDVEAVEDSTILLSLSGEPAHSQPHPLDGLAQEHKVFANLLDTMSEQIAQFQNGKQPDYDLLRDIFDYMTNYPDRLHHPHEDVIFGRIVQLVPASHAHVETLMQQHKSIAASGARFLGRLQSALDGAILPRKAVEQPALEYISLYREHMRIEEQEIFPLCRERLRREDWDAVATAFKMQDNPLLHNFTEGKYLALHRQMLRLMGSTWHES